MSEVRTYTRRSAAIPIDPALVAPTTRFAKNRAEHVGKPPIYIVVDEIEDVTDSTGTAKKVHFHYEATGRRSSMMLRDFVKGSEHRLPDPEPVVDTARPDDAPATVADVREIKAKMVQLLAAIRTRSAGPLFDKAVA